MACLELFSFLHRCLLLKGVGHRYVLPQQAIEVFVDSTLPVGKGIANLSRSSEFGIESHMTGKQPLPMVISQSAYLGNIRHEPFNNRLAESFRGLVPHLGVHSKYALSFGHSPDNVLLRTPDDCITFPVANAGAGLYGNWPIMVRAAVGCLCSAITAAGITLLFLLLAAKVTQDGRPESYRYRSTGNGLSLTGKNLTTYW